MIFWSLTFYGGGIQNAFVLQKYRKRIVSESEKTYMVVYQGSCDVSDNRFSRRIYIDVILAGNIAWTAKEDTDETGL